MIVTGASSGIGEATTRAAARAGARLVLAARRRERLEALAEEIGGDALIVPTDMRDLEQVRRLVQKAGEHFGHVDVLVNNAGQGLHVPVEKIAIEDLAAILELNVYGALVAMQAVIPLMREVGGGAIVNVSSGTTRMPAPVGAAGYAASKAALDRSRGSASSRTRPRRSPRRSWISSAAVSRKPCCSRSGCAAAAHDHGHRRHRTDRPAPVRRAGGCRPAGAGAGAQRAGRPSATGRGRRNG